MKNSTFKPVLLKLQGWSTYIRERPVLIIIILTALVSLVSYAILTQTFKFFFNCNHLITVALSLPPFICDGMEVREPVFNSLIFTIPGAKSASDPLLEGTRKGMLWFVIIFLGLLSVYLTIILNNLKTVAKLMTFDKQTWKNMFGLINTWLLVFTILISIFYFTAR